MRCIFKTNLVMQCMYNDDMNSTQQKCDYIFQNNSTILCDTLNCILSIGTHIVSTIHIWIMWVVENIYTRFHIKYECSPPLLIGMLPKYVHILILSVVISSLLCLFNMKDRVSKCMTCKRKSRYIVNRKFTLCGNHLHSFLKKKKKKTKTHCLDTRSDQNFSDSNGLLLSKKIKLNHSLN